MTHAYKSPVFKCYRDFEPFPPAFKYWLMKQLDILNQDDNLIDFERTWFRLLRTCRRQQKRERQFLRSIISGYQGDNVPLSPESCAKDCAEKKVDKATCRQLCQIPSAPCSYWQEVIDKAQQQKAKGDVTLMTSSTAPIVYHSSRTTKTHRVKRWSEAQIIPAENSSSTSEGPSTIVLTDPSKKKKKFVSIIPFAIPDPLPTPPRFPGEENNFHILPYASAQLNLRTEDELSSGKSPPPKCTELICITDDSKKSTLCFQQVANVANFALLPDDDGKIWV